MLAAAAMLALEDKNPDGAALAAQMYDRELAAFRRYSVAGPAWCPRMGPPAETYGSTLRLPDGFPYTAVTEDILPE